MWISIKKLEKLEKEIKELKEWKIELLYQIGELKSKDLTPQKLSPEQEVRLKELELWQNKLHLLMIEKTPANKEKLSKNYAWLKGRL